MDKILYKLIQTLIAAFATPVEITFQQDKIYKSTNYDLPQSRNDVSDITFTNLSQSGKLYINNIPLEPFQFRAFSCNWNEINKSNFDIRFEAGASEPFCLVDFKVIKPKNK